MGWLDNWDRHNQRSAEYHRDTAPKQDERFSEFYGFRGVAVVLAALILAQFTETLLEWIGVDNRSVRLVVLGSIAAGAAVSLVLIVRSNRSRRRHWKLKAETDRS